MTLQEAQTLIEQISLFLEQDAFLLHRLHETDFCIILKEDHFYIWGPDDWQRYRQRLERKRPRHKSDNARSAEIVT